MIASFSQEQFQQFYEFSGGGGGGGGGNNRKVPSKDQNCEHWLYIRLIWRRLVDVLMIKPSTLIQP